MTARRETLWSFRARFWVFFAVLMAATVIGALAGFGGSFALRYVLTPRKLPAWGGWEGLHLVVLAVTALNLFVAFVAVFLFKVHAGIWGLRSFDFWGRYHEVEWGEMTAAVPANLLGLRYLRVQTAGQRATLWLPLFLAEQERFYETVREYAGAGHPLVAALETHRG